MLNLCSANAGVLQMTGMHRNKTKIYWVFCQANLDSINPWLLPHITLTLELLSWLCWCCSGSPLDAKWPLLVGEWIKSLGLCALCKAWWAWLVFSCCCDPQHSSSASGMGSLQSRVGQPWETHLPWPGVPSELKDMGREFREKQEIPGSLWMPYGYWVGSELFLGVLEIFCLSPVRCFALKKKLF